MEMVILIIMVIKELQIFYFKTFIKLNATKIIDPNLNLRLFDKIK